jgi:hypothetical protein
MGLIKIRDNPNKQNNGYGLSFLVEYEQNNFKKVDEVYYESGWDGEFLISGDKQSGTSVVL